MTILQLQVLVLDILSGNCLSTLYCCTCTPGHCHYERYQYFRRVGLSILFYRTVLCHGIPCFNRNISLHSYSNLHTSYTYSVTSSVPLKGKMKDDYLRVFLHMSDVPTSSRVRSGRRVSACYLPRYCVITPPAKPRCSASCEALRTMSCPEWKVLHYHRLAIVISFSLEIALTFTMAVRLTQMKSHRDSRLIFSHVM